MYCDFRMYQELHLVELINLVLAYADNKGPDQPELNLELKEIHSAQPSQTAVWWPS